LGSAGGVDVIDIASINKQPYLKNVKHIEQIAESIRKIEISPDGNLWIQSAFNTQYKLTFKGYGKNDYEVKKFTSLGETYHGIIISGLYVFNNKIYLSTNYGIFSTQYKHSNTTNNPFLPDNSLGLDYAKDSISIQSLAQDEFGNFWIASSAGILKYDITKAEIEMANYRRLQGKPIQKIFILKDIGVSVISEEEIYILNENHIKTTDFNFRVVFTEAAIGNDAIHINFDGIFSSKFHFKQTIPKEQNNFSISFTAPFYQKNSDLTYSYMLEGFDKNWSTPTNQRSVNYTNLPSGAYVFRVVAENVYNKKSNQAEFSFKISSSWYQKPLALVAFFILAFLVVWFFVYVYTLSLKKERLKLQGIIKEAIKKEKYQKLEMEKQAGKLYLANMELQKVSLVASKTDNAVIIMDHIGNIEWINDGYTRLFGFTFSDLVNTKTNLMGDFADITINDMVNVWFGDRKPIIYENQKTTKNGNKIWVQTTLTPILDDQNKLKRLIAIETDISKLKLAESEIESQKIEIESQRDLAIYQRDEITQQKIEIVDSILYAQRIQKAVFYKEADLNTIFKNAFVYDKPRDIVSGDFFWVHQSDNLKIIATIDCTGHGIPGAFLSMIGFTFLNQIIKENQVYEPYLVLNQLREKVINSLGQKGVDDEAKDGMDVSICVLDSKARKILYAGANNRSYVLRNEKVFELEADKMPISICVSSEQSFTQNEFFYQPGDILYMFSDGYSDQFGGLGGKKFKSSRFKQLLKNISHENFANQKTMLDMEHNKWRGQLSQVDDILVVGIGLE
jgi:PAS domain S-box-containing protein